MGSLYKLDLHTHSAASADGGLTLDDYRTMLERCQLDYIAITDHDGVDFALQARQQLGGQIIVGEEVATTEGELIGLFLNEPVAPGLSPAKTAELIHRQGGLVYVPHPFETVRHGLAARSLAKLARQVDIIEVRNGRALLQNRSSAAKTWAAAHEVAGCASSDAHGRHGWGRTFTIVNEVPSAANLPAILRRGRRIEQSVGWRGAFYPKLNRLKKRAARQ